MNNSGLYFKKMKNGGIIMYQIIKNNVDEILGELLVGYKHADYTSECVSSGKVARYLAYEKTIDKLVSDIFQSGYCPKAICKPAEILAGVDLGIEGYKDLKQSADEQFEIFIAKSPVDIGRNYMAVSK